MNLITKKKDETERSKPEMTICTRCKHFYQRSEVWYDQFCKASPLEKRVDPIDGRVKCFGVNDLGNSYSTHNGYHYARNINTDGKCEKYEPKKSWLRNII